MDEKTALTEEGTLVHPRMNIGVQGLRARCAKAPLGRPEEPDDTSLTTGSEGSSETLPHSIDVIQNRS